MAAERREERQAALRAALAGEGLDGLLVTHLPNIRYLTGFMEPDAALVMVERGPERHQMLFVREKDPAREVWNGRRLGVIAVRDSLGIEGREISTLRSVLDQLLK